MKYLLKIEPAIEATNRHKIERLLVKLGYDIIGGGQWVDGRECDISFEEMGGSNAK